MPLHSARVARNVSDTSRERFGRASKAGRRGLKESAGAAVLVADVIQASDPQRPALEALLNLSLNALDTLRATRAE